MIQAEKPCVSLVLFRELEADAAPLPRAEVGLGTSMTQGYAVKCRVRLVIMIPSTKAQVASMFHGAPAGATNVALCNITLTHPSTM